MDGSPIPLTLLIGIGVINRASRFGGYRRAFTKGGGGGGVPPLHHCLATERMAEFCLVLNRKELHTSLLIEKFKTETLASIL